MRLARFIRDDADAILAEWETFARSIAPADTMDVAALRDHAKEMLLVISADLERPQTDLAQDEKARGERDAAEERSVTAAQEHGAGRAASGFSVGEMVAEFRSLRASVTRLWISEHAAEAATDLGDLIRFNEAIDQAIAESVSRFSLTVAGTRDRFLAILSHDLRTPLGAIITSMHFMVDTGGLEEPYRTLVTRAESSARRMNQMVLDLVEFARARLGETIPLARVPTDARQLVHDVVVEISASYPGSTVQLETSGDLSGSWDGDRLAQALTNLVANAVQHGAERRPIRVTARGLDQEVTFSVFNEGPAIPAADLTEIFRDGRRGGTTPLARDGHHQGLGLYIVDRIVTAHKGTVSVRSSAGEGTTFSVRLPRHH